jgi:CheY-like chemotaxis protein
MKGKTITLLPLVLGALVFISLAGLLIISLQQLAPVNLQSYSQLAPDTANSASRLPVVLGGAMALLLIINLGLSFATSQVLHLYHAGYLVAATGSHIMVAGTFEHPLDAKGIMFGLCTMFGNLLALLFYYRSLADRRALSPDCRLFAWLVAINLLPVPAWFILQPSYLYDGAVVLFSFTTFSIAVFCISKHNQTGDSFALHLGVSKGILFAAIACSGLALVSNALDRHHASLLASTGLLIDAVIITFILLGKTLKDNRALLDYRQQVAIAESRSRNQAVFLERINHEIRTPISGILGMSELLLDTPLSENQKNYTRTIENSAQELLGLVNEVLDYSRLETDTLALQEEHFDLHALVNECVQNFRLVAESKHMELISHVHQDVASRVTGDASRLRQILSQLLSNALKFTESGEVILSVEVRGKRTVFTIRDTGIGMSQRQVLQLLSDRLPDPGDEMRYQGLGFAVVKKLLAKMNGRLDISSELAKGTTISFSVDLPTHHNTTSENLAQSLLGGHLLVVDDNDSCLQVIRHQATTWGMQVTTARSGNEALAILRNRANLGESFDVAIIDQGMPGMTGMQLATRIQGDKQLNPDQTRLIMLTGLGNAPDLQLAHEAGVSRVLSKPVTGKTLKIVLMEEINKMDNQASPPPSQTDSSDQQDSINAETRVLVAEDNAISMKIIQAMLGKLGVQYQGVANGKEAVEAIKTGDYHIAFMDCEMPVMDGFEATRAIRQWETRAKQPAIPIIALTAHVMDEHKEKSHMVGMNAHLTKPVHIRDLAGAITQWVPPNRGTKNHEANA